MFTCKPEGGRVLVTWCDCNVVTSRDSRLDVFPNSQLQVEVPRAIPDLGPAAVDPIDKYCCTIYLNLARRSSVDNSWIVYLPRA